MAPRTTPDPFSTMPAGALLRAAQRAPATRADGATRRPGAPDRPPRDTPVIAVLVLSCDPAERQEVVLALSAHEGLVASSASGFHTAVPALWEHRPRVLVVGRLSPSDASRFDEIAHHADAAAVVLLPSAPARTGALAPARRLTTEDDVAEAVARIHADR